MRFSHLPCPLFDNCSCMILCRGRRTELNRPRKHSLDRTCWSIQCCRTAQHCKTAQAARRDGNKLRLVFDLRPFAWLTTPSRKSVQCFPQTSRNSPCVSARRDLWTQVQLPSLTELDLASNNISQAMRNTSLGLEGLEPWPLKPGEALHLAGAPRLVSLASSSKAWPGSGCSSGLESHSLRGRAWQPAHIARLAVVNCFLRRLLALFCASFSFTIAQPHIPGRLTESNTCTRVTAPARVPFCPTQVFMF